MSKQSLKSALERLEIKKPLKLQSSAPRFQEPESVVEEKKSTVENTSAVQKMPLDQKPVQDSIESQDTKIPRVHYPRSATAQDASVSLLQRSKDKLRVGYTRIPNELLMELIEGDHSKAEIKIALLIARMTISFQRELAPLSKTVLERMTGLQGRSVLEAVSELERKKLILKKIGDAHSPNELGILGTKEILGSSRSMGGNVPPDPDPSSEGSRKVAQGEERFFAGPGDAKVPSFKEGKTISQPLSLAELPEELQEYFANLLPQRKRESEWNYLVELNKEVSLEELGHCLAWLKKNGLPESGEPCHSPMAFLSVSLGQVLERTRKPARPVAVPSAGGSAVKPEEEDDAAEQVAAFQASGEDIEHWIKKAQERYPHLNLNPVSLGAKTMALKVWWEEGRVSI